MKKQTAVEWLLEQIDDMYIHQIYSKQFEQALEIGKQQIVEAYEEGYSDGVFYEDERLDKELAEQYYKETYED
jgi:predicted oxidoreductase (fatty acid repression mutant protein)